MKQERSTQAAVVIGGGIIGLSTALALQKRGLTAQVFDAPKACPPASWGNAGHIAIEQHEPLASWPSIRSLPGRLMLAGGAASFPVSGMAYWLPFGLRLMAAAQPNRFFRGKQALQSLLCHALPAWRRMLEDAHAVSLLKEEGHIVAWSNPKKAAAARRALTSFDHPSVSWRDLTSHEMPFLNAQLSQPVADAVRYEGTASVADPGAVLIALKTALLQHGGSFVEAPISVRGAQKIAPIVIIAAGVESVGLMREVGYAVPMIAERGYHIQSAHTRWPAALPPVVIEDRALVVTRFLSGLRATSFVEFTRADAPPDERKWDRLKQHAKAIGLPFDSPLTTWHGARPTLPDYLPAIGRIQAEPGVLYAFGHQHLGLTLGPITGEIMANLVMGETPPLKLGAFAIERFGEQCAQSSRVSYTPIGPTAPRLY